MHLEHARAVAAAIRQGNYNQSMWWDARGSTLEAADLIKHKCGSTACVAGWAAALAHPRGRFTGASTISLGLMGSHDIYDAGSRYLKLAKVQADWLFSSFRDDYEVLWALENGNGDWDPADCPRVVAEEEPGD